MGEPKLEEVGPIRIDLWDRYYQYFWWVETPEGETNFLAQGNYGHYIYVAPEKDLVIVRLGKEEGERGYGYWTSLFEDLSTKLDTSAKGSR